MADAPKRLEPLTVEAHTAIINSLGSNFQQLIDVLDGHEHPRIAGDYIASIRGNPDVVEQIRQHYADAIDVWNKKHPDDLATPISPQQETAPMHNGGEPVAPTEPPPPILNAATEGDGKPAGRLRRFGSVVLGAARAIPNIIGRGKNSGGEAAIFSGADAEILPLEEAPANVPPEPWPYRFVRPHSQMHKIIEEAQRQEQDNAGVPEGYSAALINFLDVQRYNGSEVRAQKIQEFVTSHFGDKPEAEAWGIKIGEALEAHNNAFLCEYSIEGTALERLSEKVPAENLENFYIIVGQKLDIMLGEDSSGQPKPVMPDDATKIFGDDFTREQFQELAAALKRQRTARKVDSRIIVGSQLDTLVNDVRLNMPAEFSPRIREDLLVLIDGRTQPGGIGFDPIAPKEVDELKTFMNDARAPGTGPFDDEKVEAFRNLFNAALELHQSAVGVRHWIAGTRLETICHNFLIAGDHTTASNEELLTRIGHYIINPREKMELEKVREFLEGARNNPSIVITDKDVSDFWLDFNAALNQYRQGEMTLVEGLAKDALRHHHADPTDKFKIDFAANENHWDNISRVAQYEKGNSTAQFVTGMAHELGWFGQEVNPEEAAKWYQLAGAQGHVGALVNHAILIRNGYGIDKSPDAKSPAEQARELIRYAVNKGWPKEEVLIPAYRFAKWANRHRKWADKVWGVEPEVGGWFSRRFSNKPQIVRLWKEHQDITRPADAAGRDGASEPVAVPAGTDAGGDRADEPIAGSTPAPDAGKPKGMSRRGFWLGASAVTVVAAVGAGATGVVLGGKHPELLDYVPGLKRPMAGPAEKPVTVLTPNSGERVDSFANRLKTALDANGKVRIDDGLAQLELRDTGDKYELWEPRHNIYFGGDDGHIITNTAIMLLKKDPTTKEHEHIFHRWATAIVENKEDDDIKLSIQPWIGKYGEPKIVVDAPHAERSQNMRFAKSSAPQNSRA